MRLGSARVSVLLLLVALAMPSVAPLVDHHFAERQVGHSHVGVIQSDAHTHGYKHFHSHSHGSDDGSDGRPVAMYEHESGAAAPVVVIDDATTLPFGLFEPGLFLLIWPKGQSRAKDYHPAPPKRPPQYAL
jgi:hypothetical protein